MSRGSKYTDADRRRACEEYALCNSLADVSESMGISRRTLADWHKSAWWDQLTVELRHQEQGELVPTGEHGEVAETKIGRPTAYKPEYAKHALRLCLLGATDEELAAFFEVSQTTVDNWKIKYPDFLGSLRQGKIEADSRVAQSLFARATGYSHPEEKILQHQGKVVRVDTTKHYPPDTQAAGLWLKNRRSRDWRETRHIQTESTEEQRLVVELPLELMQKLAASAGDSIDFRVSGIPVDRNVIEGVFEQVDAGERASE